MKLVADAPSIHLLRGRKINIKAIRKVQPVISDKQVLKLAADENRTTVTHDSEYGELIFKYGFKPEAGVSYFPFACLCLGRQALLIPMDRD